MGNTRKHFWKDQRAAGCKNNISQDGAVVSITVLEARRLGSILNRTKDFLKMVVTASTVLTYHLAKPAYVKIYLKIVKQRWQSLSKGLLSSWPRRLGEPWIGSYLKYSQKQSPKQQEIDCVPAWASHNLFDQFAELCKPAFHFWQLFKLSIVELLQLISITLLDSAQAHVTDAVTHFTNV